MDENQLSNLVIGAAIEVHRHLGPGLLENIYEKVLAIELAGREIPFEEQKTVPVVYKGNRVDIGYRLDFLVGGLLVVELKSVAEVLPIHKAQVLTYLRLTNCKLRLLLNFNVELMVKGIDRIVNNLPETTVRNKRPLKPLSSV